MAEKPTLQTTSSISHAEGSNSADIEWYLAAAKPRQELRAVENLKYQGIQCFCPQAKIERLVRGKKVIKQEALFSGYLFICLSQQDPNWHKVRSTRGIRDWIRFSGNVAKLPTSLVDSLIEVEAAKENLIINRINPGQTVRILSGPFAGLKAVFEKEDGDSRAMILIDFLGKTNHLKVENEQIVLE